MRKIIFLIILKFILCNKNKNNLKIIQNKKNKIYYSSKLFKSYNFPNFINKSSTKKNILIGIIVNYSWEKILPFIKSLNTANFINSDIIMFISGLTKSVINNLNSFGIIIYNIPNKFKDVQNIYSDRWKIYEDFLNNNKDKYNLVLSVDIKDTIFQNNFFSFYENYDNILGFSLEESTLENSMNKYWIIERFGNATYEKIKNKRIINAGTIWGTINTFIEFSSILYKNLLKYPEAYDQSVVNYLIYHENILGNCTKISSDGYGLVITLGLTNRKNIILDIKNNILNYNSQIASIIHQYDRHEDIKRIIKEKYCPELIRNNFIINFFLILELFTFILFIKSKFNLLISKIKK